jgi:hypothetical protein
MSTQETTEINIDNESKIDNFNDCEEDDVFNEVDVENENEKNTNFEYKFSSPEACAERLGKLPSNILSALRSLNEEVIFDIFITELKVRCHDCKNRLDKYSPERMWTQIVFSKCMDFKHEHFRNKNNNLDRVSTDFLTFMRNVDIVSILQILVDVAQQNGYHSKQLFDNLSNEHKMNYINQKDYDDAKNRWLLNQQQYHNYVNLFRHCTGTWKPMKKRSISFQTNYNTNQANYNTNQANYNTNQTNYNTNQANYNTNQFNHNIPRDTIHLVPQRIVRNTNNFIGKKQYIPGSYKNYNNQNKDGGFRQSTEFPIQRSN